MTRSFCAASAAIVVAFASSAAMADLVITEVMSQTTSGTAGTINGDWWELTNSGAAAIVLGGFSWADTEDQIGGPTPQPNFFPGVTINPGESIIILEEDTANLAAWRSNWNVTNNLQILATDVMLPDPSGNGDTFSGLSSNGDAVYFYDPAGTLIDAFIFGSVNPRGTSFERDIFGNDLGVSVVGENGAYMGANGDVGSPGVAVPAPGAMSLFGLAAFAARRRRAR